MADVSAKQTQAIIALLSSPSVSDAAAAVGMGERTLYRWMKDPEFKAAYNEAKLAAMGQATTRLQGSASEAAETLVRIMNDESVRAATRVHAAKAVLEFGLQGQEAELIIERLARLEGQIDTHI